MGRMQSRKKAGRFAAPVPRQSRPPMAEQWVRDGWGTEAEFGEAMGELVEAGMVHLAAGADGRDIPQAAVRLSTVHSMPAAEFEDGLGVGLYLAKDAFGRWMPRPGSGWRQLPDGDWILLGPEF
jgi:hypothetical protein